MKATTEDGPTERERFKFDLQGYLTMRGFLDAKAVAELNALLDPICLRYKGRPKFDFVADNPRFIDLIRDRRLLQTVAAFVGAHFRFAGAWGIHGRPQNRNLHAGPFSAQGLNQFSSVAGRPVCSCLVVGFNLTSQLPGDGGLVFLPGSHKLSTGIDGAAVFNRLFGGKMDDDCVAQPTFEAGDLVVFAEATIHGTECWRPTDRARRVLYYKFSHGFSAYLPESDEQLKKLRTMARDEQERRLFEGAWVRSEGGANADSAKTRPKTIVPE
jgi:hypothetical protein